jgi:hypothetical protein
MKICFFLIAVDKQYILLQAATVPRSYLRFLATETSKEIQMVQTAEYFFFQALHIKRMMHL